MSDVIYAKSLYTPAIMELEKAADFIELCAALAESGVVVAFASEVAGALRERAETFRQREATWTG